MSVISRDADCGIVQRMRCVDSGTALQLLKLRPTSETQPVCLTVYSQVKNVSEIIQIKDSQLFLVKLLPNLDIICKRKDMLHLHDSITPGNSFVFTNLRHTTLKKGSSFPSPVYTVTKETRILPEKSVDVIMMNMGDWLKEHGFEYVPPSLEITGEEILFTYIGVITDILDARLGVYELDSKVRLFIGQVPALHKYRDLRVGMKIMIHNAHQDTTKEILKLYGCMLTNVKVIEHSNLEVEIESKIQTPQILKNYLYLYKVSYRKLEYLYNICKTVQQKFSHLGRRVCDKLIAVILLADKLSWKQDRDKNYRNHLDEFLHCPHACPLQEHKDECFPEMICVKSLHENLTVPVENNQSWYCTHKSVASDQVLLGEISICEKTGLSVLKDNTGHTETIITCYMTDQPARQDIKNRGIHKCSAWCDCTELEPGSPFKCPYFHTCCVGKIVAVIKYSIISENNPRLDNNFHDDTVTRDCKRYIAFSLTDTFLLGHKKLWINDRKVDHVTEKRTITGDDKKTTESYLKQLHGSKTTCEMVETANVSKSNGLETLTESKETTNSYDHVTNFNQSDPSRLHRHLCQDGRSYFCRKSDCADDEQNTVSETKETNELQVTRRRLRECCNTDQSHSTKLETSKSIGVPMKRKITSTTGIENINMADGNVPLCEKRQKDTVKCINTVSFESNNCYHKNREHKGEVKQDNSEFSDASWEDSTETVTVIIYRKEALVLEEMNGNQSARFCIQGQLLQHGNAAQESDSKSSAADLLQMVVIMFKGRASRWYSVIHSQSLYRLSVPAELSPLFKNNVGSLKVVTEKLRKQNCPVFMVVNEQVEIEQIYPEEGAEIGGLNSSTVMCNTECPASIFSGVFEDIQGVVLSRTFVKNDGTQGRTDKVCTRIKLKCGDDEIVQVYLNPENFSSPLGLVPGSVVCFTRLERRVSQLGNIYWRFIPKSSLTVLALRQTSTGSQFGQNEEHHSTTPTYYLRDVWEHKFRVGSDVFKCVCSVQQILKVSLKYVCDYCGSMVVKSTCSNAGCFNTEMGRFLARASILVDDGTSVAMVTLTGDTIKELLLMTDVQWEAMQAETSTQGEIFVQQARPELNNAMEHFLYLLCDNRLVKKSWTMKLKLKPATKYTDLDKMKCEEFGQKTFDTGSNKVTTRCLPFLQLECLQLQDVDHYQLSLDLMTQTS